MTKLLYLLIALISVFNLQGCGTEEERAERKRIQEEKAIERKNLKATKLRLKNDKKQREIIQNEQDPEGLVSGTLQPVQG